MVNRIYVVGPVGGGKSTLARELSNQFGFTCSELDSVVYEPDQSSSSGNRKRPEKVRDAMFHEILSKERWVVEDTGRAYFELALKQADSIIQLEPPISVRRYRIIRRWIKQNLHMEKCGYIPDMKMLRLMLKWTNNYESGADGVKERLTFYKAKITVIKTKKDINNYICRYLAV